MLLPCKPMTDRERFDRLTELLACPACHSPLHQVQQTLACDREQHRFLLHDGVPSFIAGRPESMPSDHKSNSLGAEFEDILRCEDRVTLNIGAGATAHRYENCVEFEHKIFRHTDVVGDAHALPFRDSVFDQIFAFNVFEHLRDPKRAASEMRRVLKPGGSVAIHSAFLQPLHEAPNHFYNATEFGMREWFSAFDIDACFVSPNFGPGMMLSYLASTVLDAVVSGGVSPNERSRLGDTTLEEWAEHWRKRGAPPPSFDMLQNLPQELQARVAAGFQLTAHKPVSSAP